MCAGAIVLSKIENLYFGAFDKKSGACGTVLDITNNKSLNHKSNVYGGILDYDCGEILRSFFKIKRDNQDFT
jgi:tRNA(adenine34) deaminase